MLKIDIKNTRERFFIKFLVKLLCIGMTLISGIQYTHANTHQQFRRIDYFVYDRHFDKYGKFVENPSRLKNVDILFFHHIESGVNGSISYGDSVTQNEFEAAYNGLLNEREKNNENFVIWLSISSLDSLVDSHGNVIETNLTNFIKNLKDLISEHPKLVSQQGGGLNFDWEGTKPTVSSFKEIIEKIYKSIMSSYPNISQLSMTIGWGNWGLDHYFDKAKALKDDLDFIQIMYYGSVNSKSSSQMMDTLDNTVAAGISIPKSKIFVGLPIYGDDNNNDSTAKYKDLISQGCSKDEDVCEIGKYTYYYNSIERIKNKISKLRNEGYAGVFTWEMSMDMPYNDDSSIIKTIDQSLMGATLYQ
ncbi:glycoside hydrolase family 18 protein [Cysteiniphilum halobium]|uniref:glycoside hydrolase family 18 protein n=1 Tax=Cysteiniphilum halobium TaxID=2219059 RepID=UPI003F82A03A